MANNSVRGLNALGYVGVNAPNPPNTLISNRAPTQNDYAQFNLLDQWLFYTPTEQNLYILTSKAKGIATWQFIGGTPGGMYNTNGVIYWDGAEFNSTVAGVTGQVLMGNNGAAPSWGPHPVGVTWNNVVVANYQMSSNFGYLASDLISRVTLTLPALPLFGDILEIAGDPAAMGWQIAQNALQSIQFGTAVTTTGVTGYLQSTQPSDTIKLLCVDPGAAASWLALSSIGNITVH